MYALVRLIDTLVDLYVMLIFVYILLSWIPRGTGNVLESVRSVLAAISEPLLTPFRKLIPSFNGIDFSPIVAILVLQLVWRLLRPILM